MNSAVHNPRNARGPETLEVGDAVAISDLETEEELRGG
jgi:hypothetical protein